MNKAELISKALRLIFKNPDSQLVPVLKDIFNRREDTDFVDKLRDYVMRSNVLSYSEQQEAIKKMTQKTAEDANTKRGEDAEGYNPILK